MVSPMILNLNQMRNHIIENLSLLTLTMQRSEERRVVGHLRIWWVIPSGKKGRQSKTRLVKALVDSGASESILAKAKSDKLPVKKTKKERQWSKAAGVLTTNTKIETSFSFPELHANKLINQYLHVVDLNIDRYDMIIGRDLIRSLGIDIHGGDMTIHWYDAAIP